MIVGLFLLLVPVAALTFFVLVPVRIDLGHLAVEIDRQITELLNDSEYAEFQAALALRPDLGKLIPAAGGLRKVRLSHAGRGKAKRGGTRVIYYWHQPGEAIYLLVAY